MSVEELLYLCIQELAYVQAVEDCDSFSYETYSAGTCRRLVQLHTRCLLQWANRRKGELKCNQ